MQYPKGPLTFAQQMALMMQRGLTIPNQPNAELYLKKVGYYRLMGYLFPLRIPGSDNFVQGASFDTAVGLYLFDQQLRGLVLEALGHIEVAVRTAVTYELGHAYGAFAHCSSANVNKPAQWHTDWLDGVHNEVHRARETFVDHYKKKYDGFPQLPIWMASEVMSLGTLSKLVQAMHAKDRSNVAAHFATHDPVFESWVHAMVVVRNICAHHGRLWNRVFGVKPKRPRSANWQHMPLLMPNDRVFFMLCVIKSLLTSTAADVIAWRDAVNRLLGPFLADPANLPKMGAPVNWVNHPLWR